MDLNTKLKSLSYIRTVLAATLGYYTDNIKNVVIENGEIIEKYIPINLSKNGDPQYIEDNFFDKDLDKCSENIKINGDTNQLPSGIITITDFEIDDTSQINTNNAVVYDSLEKDHFFDEWKKRYTRADFIPMNLTGKLIIRTSTLLSSFIISENIIDLHYKTRIILVSYGGLHKLPVALQLGNKLATTKKRVGYKLGDDNQKFIEIEIPITIVCWYPVKNRVVNYNTKIKSVEQTISPKENK
jgi:hypothetical protein